MKIIISLKLIRLSWTVSDFNLLPGIFNNSAVQTVLYLNPVKCSVVLFSLKNDENLIKHDYKLEQTLFSRSTFVILESTSKENNPLLRMCKA